MSMTADRPRASLRGRIDRNPALRRSYRVAVGVVGALVVAVGIVAIPYPGPGWLIVFTGLAILATEFAWARRLLHFARSRYDAWTAWLARQHVLIRLGVLALTGLVVVATLYLLNVFGMVLTWARLDGLTWLHSPIFT